MRSERGVLPHGASNISVFIKELQMNVLDDDKEYDIRVEQLIVGECGGQDTIADDVEYTSASCSVTFVTDDRIKMLVDCSSSYERHQLLEVLKERNLKPEEIDYLVITHWHVDHCGNINLFPKATVIDPHNYADHKLSEFSGSVWFNLYSGHSESDLVVVVKQRVSGSKMAVENVRIIVIAGDLFECENDDDKKGGNYWHSNSLMPNSQLVARGICLSSADIIVPGHGAAFSARKSSNEWSLKKCLPPIICLLTFDYGLNQQCRVFAVKYSSGVLLINTGGTKQTDYLLAALSRENITVDNVKHIVITTVNVTTMANVNLFPRARVYTSTDRSLPPRFYTATSVIDYIVEDEILLLRASSSNGHVEQLMVVIKQEQRPEYLVICEELYTPMKWLQHRVFGREKKPPMMLIKTTHLTGVNLEQ